MRARRRPSRGRSSRSAETPSSLTAPDEGAAGAKKGVGGLVVDKESSPAVSRVQTSVADGGCRPVGRKISASERSPGSWSCKLARKRSCICPALSAVAPASHAVAALQEGDKPQLPCPGKRPQQRADIAQFGFLEPNCGGSRGDGERCRRVPPVARLDARAPGATIAATSFRFPKPFGQGRPLIAHSQASTQIDRNRVRRLVSLCLPRVADVLTERTPIGAHCIESSRSVLQTRSGCSAPAASASRTPRR